MTAARGSIRHQGRTIEYDIIRRPAVTRRIHLEMDRNGVLQVVAPRGMSHQALNRALQKRSQRVDRFLGEARARLRDLPELSWLSGEAHLFLGKRYPLEVSVQTSKTGAVALEEGKIRVLTTGGRPEQVKNQVVRWYRQQAQRQFARRLALFCNDAPWVGPELPPLRLRRMKRTWGSCSSKGVITLNTHLVKAPVDLVDYVIAHEICHLQEPNHGKAFYALQRGFYPPWRAARARLRAEGHLFLHE